MNIPKKVYANTTIKWREGPVTDPFGESITNANGTLKYYLRTNVRPQGLAVTGTTHGNGWEFVISKDDSKTFAAGDWYFYVEASDGTETFTLGQGRFEVLSSLSFSDSPGKYDGRSDAEIERDGIKEALAKFKDGAQEYSIGGRTFKRASMADLQMRLDRLNAIIVRERKAAMIANGLGDPHSLYVRF